MVHPRLPLVLLTVLCCNWVAATFPEQRHSCDCKRLLTCPYSGSLGDGRICSLADGSFGFCCLSLKPSPVFEECRPLVLCPEAIADPQSSSRRPCRLLDGSDGVLCDLSVSNPGFVQHERRPAEDESVGALRRAGLQPIPDSRLVSDGSSAIRSRATIQTPADAEAANRILSQAFRQLQYNEQLFSLGDLFAITNTSSEVFGFNFASTSDAQDLGHRALEQIQVLKDSEVRLAHPLANYFVDANDNPIILRNCTPEPEPQCFPDGGRFRTISGECNNLRRPRLGRALTGFKRLLPGVFDDGIFALRSRGILGDPLPSARLVSERLVETASRELRGFTLSVMQWGQFIDHDFTHALIFRQDSRTIECCKNDGQEFPEERLPIQCIPIRIPSDDPFYSQFAQRCMNLVRSLPTPDPDCVGRPSTPINELTTFLDASMVYGSQEEELQRLRTFTNGLLKFSPDGDQLLPLCNAARSRSSLIFPGPTSSSSSEGQCPFTTCRERKCNLAGETRVNEQSALTVMHTIFVRRHNFIASELQSFHSNWSDERLFQESRRILIAEWQHVIYNEWLPVVVGFQYARRHALLPLQSGFSFFYDSTINPSPSNEFATAGFRFGHSLLRDIYDLVTAQGRIASSVNLTDTFFRRIVNADNFVQHARTLIKSRQETFDRNIIRGVHEQLFTTNSLFGMDLIALNVQRGRDHGLPTYVSMLRACTRLEVTSWSALRNLMDAQTISLLQSVYSHPADIDLFIGGLSERVVPGAQVGPTFQCLIGQQFFELRYGDRFFYDNGGFQHSFSDPQLQQIRRTSWARIMCDTLGSSFNGDFTRVQPLAFNEPFTFTNNIVDCQTLAIPKLDLSVF